MVQPVWPKSGDWWKTSVGYHSHDEKDQFVIQSFREDRSSITQQANCVSEALSAHPKVKGIARQIQRCKKADETSAHSLMWVKWPWATLKITSMYWSKSLCEDDDSAVVTLIRHQNDADLGSVRKPCKSNHSRRCLWNLYRYPELKEAQAKSHHVSLGDLFSYQ